MSGDVGHVAERDVLELDVAGGVLGRIRGVADVGLSSRLVEQLEDALGGGDRRLEDVRDAGRLGDRHRELARVLDERLDVAEATSGRWRPGPRR